MRKLRITGDSDNALSLRVFDAETGEPVTNVERVEMVLTSSGWVLAKVTLIGPGSDSKGRPRRTHHIGARIDLDVVAREVRA